MTIGISSSLLMNLYQSRLGATGAGTSSTGAPSRKVAPTAPWNRPPAVDPGEAVKSALNGRRLIDESSAQLDLPGASADYRKLFALYQGLSTLNGVAEQMQRKGLAAFEKIRIQSVFAKGLAEIGAYVKSAEFEKLRLIQGEAATSTKTTVPVPRSKTEYITDPLVSGTSNDAVPAFAGDVRFDIKVKRAGVDNTVAIDLAGMGGAVRSMANVVTFINDKLAAAGVDTRVATHRTAGQPRTTEAGGKTITIGPGADQWSLKVKMSLGETVAFAAPATAGAVYMAQGAGNPNPDGKPDTADSAVVQQLVKFQTDTATVPAPVQGTGETYWVDGRAFSRTMGPEVKAIRATKVGADGSVYMLADVTAKTAGQDIKGEQDVALLKYDAAGRIVYARTLGASDTASGLGLALSVDGKVAVAGAVTGGLAGAVDGTLNSGESGSFASFADSFVTVFNADGEELWTHRRGARQADEASQVTFGADGTVYVAGRAQSQMPGAGAPAGGWDSYIEAFRADAAGVVKPVFTQSFGSAASDRPAGMVLDGTSLVTASVEDGRAVLRRFDVSGGAPVLTATRDLGDLQGGEITGLALDGGQIVIAGSTRNAALAAGTVSRAHAGGVDAFAAKLSADLTAGGGDRIAYYGGAGDDRASALAVSGGQVWIAGAAGTDLPGHTAAVGKQDGFLARLDVGAGTVAWSRRFSGKDGYAAPSSIAVDPNGASVLDRIGLPKGEIDPTDSQRITAQSSLRAGDQFTIRTGSGPARTVTIDNAETLDTLAQKIRRAAGFQVQVAVSSANGMRRLTVTPISDRAMVEFAAGKTDRDALEMLGIPEGVIRKTVIGDDGKAVSADGKPNIYGLSLDTDLRIDDAKELSHAFAEIAKAQGVVRSAYRDLVAAASPRAAQSSIPSGPVPTYLQNQIASYQAALARLGGGGG